MKKRKHRRIPGEFLNYYERELWIEKVGQTCAGCAGPIGFDRDFIPADQRWPWYLVEGKNIDVKCELRHVQCG